jgi:hypothetical protein
MDLLCNQTTKRMKVKADYKIKLIIGCMVMLENLNGLEGRAFVVDMVVFCTC